MMMMTSRPEVKQWTVFRVYYNAPRDDQRLKKGERTFFEASSVAEVYEKVERLGIDWATIATTRTDFVEVSTVNPVELEESRTMTRRAENGSLAERLRARLREYDDTLETPGQAQDIAEADLRDDVHAMVELYAEMWRQLERPS